MLIKERAMVHFFDRFSDHPFVIRMDGHEDKIGEGTPAFVVNLKRQIPVKELASSTSLALGEAICGEIWRSRGIYTRLWTISLGR